MGRLSAMLAACATISASCEPSRELEDREASPALGVAVGPATGGWKALDPPSERLQLMTGDLADHRDRALLGEHVRLADGGLLAAIVFTPHEFEALTCYVDLQQTPDGFVPRGAGIFYGWCVGMGWVAELRGTVTVDASDPSELLMRLDLDGEGGDGGGLPSGHALRGTYRILTAAESSDLRRDVARWPDGPVLARH